MLDNLFNFIILLTMAVCGLTAAWAGRAVAGGLAVLLGLLGLTTAGVAIVALVQPG